jgi:hypothetical protein
MFPLPSSCASALRASCSPASACGCSQDRCTYTPADPPGLTATPLTEPSASRSTTLFSRLDDPKQTGIDFVSPVDLEHKKSFLYHSGTATGGVAIGDVDGDSKPDLYIVSGPRGNKLYRTDG